MWWFERIFKTNTPIERIVAPIVCMASAEIMKSYQQGDRLVDKIYYKGEGKMKIDVEKIKAEIERLKTLKAEEYCKDAIEKLLADFEQSREHEIEKLETTLAICEKFEVVDTLPEEVVNTDSEAQAEVQVSNEVIY